MKKPTKKQFSVNIDMRWSEEFVISATTNAEAKKKAWDKFSKRIPKRNFAIGADKL